jgi:hypothetical protein
MEAVKTKAIRKMVNQLCWEIRPDAVSLVKAFDIPDSCLAANCIVGAITLNLRLLINKSNSYSPSIKPK